METYKCLIAMVIVVVPSDCSPFQMAMKMACKWGLLTRDDPPSGVLMKTDFLGKSQRSQPHKDS